MRERSKLDIDPKWGPYYVFDKLMENKISFTVTFDEFGTMHIKTSEQPEETPAQIS